MAKLIVQDRVLNKSDVITVKINDKKEKKVKRFLTRSLKATYEKFKNDYPELRIGKSKFYSLQPKYVLLSPIKEVCLCIYCANYDLFLTSLINFRVALQSWMKFGQK